MSLPCNPVNPRTEFQDGRVDVEDARRRMLVERFKRDRKAAGSHADNINDQAKQELATEKITAIPPSTGRPGQPPARAYLDWRGIAKRGRELSVSSSLRTTEIAIKVAGEFRTSKDYVFRIWKKTTGWTIE